jgi:hypothetical protein
MGALKRRDSDLLYNAFRARSGRVEIETGKWQPIFFIS